MDLLGSARETVRRLEALSQTVGLKYLELPEAPVSAGIAIGFGDVDYVVVSVIGGDEATVSISCGVLRDIERDEARALRLCNDLTRNRPAYPVYLHDAPIGWDILLSTQLPTQILLADPAFYDALVRGLPTIAAEARAAAEESRLGGAPYRWTEDDVQRLLVCSSM